MGCRIAKTSALVVALCAFSEIRASPGGDAPLSVEAGAASQFLRPAPAAACDTASCTVSQPEDAPGPAEKAPPGSVPSETQAKKAHPKNRQPADTCCVELPVELPPPFLLRLRHLEGTGVGFSTGYSTVQLLTTPLDCWLEDFYLLDLRAHLFNDGKWAANGGVAYRYFTETAKAFGVNGFYDYRRSTHQDSYSQVGAGLEYMGGAFDFRINGYLPIGKTRHVYDTSFQQFSVQNILISQSTEYALAGFDAEAGFELISKGTGSLYAALGGYGLWGRHSGPHATGGKARLAASWSWLELEGGVQYDKYFHWTGYGQLSLVLPLWKLVDEGRVSVMRSTLPKRAFVPVQRNEIIALATNTLTDFAINPTTSAPYTVWFVNNAATGSDTGTFENPFTDLGSAEAASSASDIIYVYAGDGTGYANNITLKSGQFLFGTGSAQTIGTQWGGVILPQFEALGPLMNGTVPFTLSDNNTISGFRFDANLAISGSGRTGASILSNVFLAQESVALSNMDGAITISGNTFSSTTSNSQLSITWSGTSNYAPILTIANNTFNPARSGIFLEDVSTTNAFDLVATIQNNTFVNAAATLDAIIEVETLDTTIGKTGVFNVTGNRFTQAATQSAFQLSTTNDTTIILQSNAFGSTSYAAIVDVISDTGASVCLTAGGNTNTGGYTFTQQSTGTFTLDFDSSNTGTVTEVGAITTGSCP